MNQVLFKTNKQEKSATEEYIQILKDALKMGLSVVEEVWRYKTGDWVSSVHAADIDRDGDMEIIAGSRDASAYVLSKRGGLKWRFDIGQWAGAVYGVPEQEGDDIDIRVLVGSRDANVYALDEKGNLQWEYATDHVVRSIYVTDIDKDGDVEILVGSEDRSIYAIDRKGNLKWRYDTNGWIRTVYPKDIDQDGDIEIIGGSGDKNLYVLDKEGKLKWKRDIGSKIHSIFAIDVDQDGDIEILTSSDGKDLCALDKKGNLKWKHEPDNRILSIYAVDTNRDGNIEIIAGSEDKHVYFISGKGELIWKFKTDSRIFSVYAVDIDRDGHLEFITGSEDSCVHVYKLHLKEGLLDKILGSYEKIGSPPVDTLGLNVKERELLRDLLGEEALAEKGITFDKCKKAYQVGNYREALSLFLGLIEQKVELQWKRRIGYVRKVCVGDLNQDGNLEIVACTDDGDIHVLDGKGNLVWTYEVGDRVWSVQSADVDQDGAMEVVAGSGDGHVRVIDNTGHLKWKSEMDDWIRGVYITDPVRDGCMEMIFGSEGKRIHIYDSNYNVKSLYETGHRIRVVCSADIDQDGDLEVIGGADDNHVYVYDREGNLKWFYKTRDRIRGLCTEDIDQDGLVEILVGSEDRNVYILDAQGNLKWRYDTPHRVLDVDAADLDQDGDIEILLGSGDGNIYVLSSEGDMKWGYKIGDRVRGVRAKDIDRDGAIEIIAGSEDRNIYVFKVIKEDDVLDWLEKCWVALKEEEKKDERALIQELSKSKDEFLRGYSITRLAKLDKLDNSDFQLLDNLVNDNAIYVRTSFARALPDIFERNPERSLYYFSQLAEDGCKEIRLALVDSLPRIAQTDIFVAFEYLDRLSRDHDKWVRRNVIRKLGRLSSTSPAQAFRILCRTAVDEDEWIRHETARSLAQYFDAHPNRLFPDIRGLLINGCGPDVLRAASVLATGEVVRDVLCVGYKLLGNTNEANVLENLEEAVRVFRKAVELDYGKEFCSVYEELYRLHTFKSTRAIAGYVPRWDKLPSEGKNLFPEVFDALMKLSEIGDMLSKYWKRETLGDRLAFLLDAVSSIESLQKDISKAFLVAEGSAISLPERAILDMLLSNWREIVRKDLAKLRGRAELRPELRTKFIPFEKEIILLLEVRNVGKSPAENVKIKLTNEDGYAIIGEDNRSFEFVSSQGSVIAEFAIKPTKMTHRITLRLFYDDAEGKNKSYPFADRIEFFTLKREFKPIHNPYHFGTPIRLDMFFGRQDVLYFLKVNLGGGVVTDNIIVLHGQRRTGKSSILYYLLNTSLLPFKIPVYIDMQRLMDVDTATFFYRLAREICSALKQEGLVIKKPRLGDFVKNPALIFDDLLDEIEDELGDRKIILMFDEFELLDKKVKEGTISQDIFGYFRSLMQHREKLNFIFTGTHTLQLLSHDYWSVFFNIALHRKISFLDEKSATELITQPVVGQLEYDELAVAKIRQLTACHPYFIQLICHSLINYCNDEEINYVTINDINIVLEDVMETGQDHCKFVWTNSTVTERILLSIIAQEGGDEGHSVSLEDVKRVHKENDINDIDFDEEAVRNALQNLVGRDILKEVLEGTKFRLTVGLIRMWLREAKPLERVLREEM